jgi:Predicted membrane protein (DUF2207)
MNKQWIRRIIISVAIVMVILFVNSSGSFATGTPFHWNHINVEIDVQENGDMLVTENQEYEFSANSTNQRYRYIQLSKIGSINDVTVTEKNQVIPSQTGIKNNQFWISWQHQLKAPEIHTFILKYRVVGGLQVDDQNTQVYWKAIFADRQAPVDKAAVQVHLPEILAGKVTDFRGLGVNNDFRKVDDKTFAFSAKQPLQPGEELEVQVAFPSKILQLAPVSQPQSITTTKNSDSFFPMVIFVPFLLAIFAIFALLVYRKHCPDCKKLTLKRTAQKSSYAKATGTGKTRVIHHCPNCSYHHEYLVASMVGYHDNGYHSHGGGGSGYDGGSGGGYGGGDGGGSGGGGGG